MIIDVPGNSLNLLHESLSSRNSYKPLPEHEEILSYVAALAFALIEELNFDSNKWQESLTPYLSILALANDVVISTIEKYRSLCEDATMGLLDSSDSEDDSDLEICNIRFSLAYGGKILLHKTRLRLKRGHVYGLVGQNGVGKTTLMTAINNGKLEGWPIGLRTHYVDSGSNVDPLHNAKNVLTHLKTSTKQDIDPNMPLLSKHLKFTKEMLQGTIGELSGGWQMKLRLAEAVLVKPDILLLDEPTNHLDSSCVQWLTSYLKTQRDTTVLCVSHDTQFMENICSDIIHYEQRVEWGPHRKLVHYKGSMSAFVEKQPQAKHYFELSETDTLSFKFPDPGRLDGVKTSTQKIVELENVNFKYDSNDFYTLTDINLKMTLSSRAVILGANGAGKTTLVKMIVGETLPSNLGQCKFFIHHNLRVAYVAQHSFFHVEQHMEQSPVNYIQWRFKDSYDKEKLESEAYKITLEEQAAIDKFNLEGIWSRRVRAGVIEYEVKKKGVKEKDNKYYSREELLGLGFEHLIKQTDEKIAAKEAGLDLRPVTTTEVQKHLDDFALSQDFGTYGKIRGLSGGQKVKLVLAAALWNCPHLLVLDEPTNYLDREALGALSKALNEWGGAVLMISHNKEFYSSICKEEWKVEGGKLTIEGISQERAMKAVAKKKKFAKELDNEEVIEKAGGNLNTSGDKYKDATINFWGKTVSKKEARNFDKAKKKGDVETMRKILQIPFGKVMPGHEELGDGKTKK